MAVREIVVALATSFVFLLVAFSMDGGLRGVSYEKSFSHEVTFTDSSESGLAIMPASCASNPEYYHGVLDSAVDENGYSFVSETGQTEYGTYGCYGGNGLCNEGGTGEAVYICTTNTSGNSYFIHANTTAELNAVKALGSSIPGLQIW